MRWLRKSLRFNRPSLNAGLVAVVLAVCLVLVGVDAWRTWQNRDTILAADMAETENLARSLAQHAHDLVQTTDVILLGLQERIAADGLSPPALARLNALMTRQAEAVPAILRLTVFDPNGDWLTGTGPHAPDDGSVARREYFIRHRDQPNTAVYLDDPRRSRADGRWLLIVSRRIDDEAGGFAGIVEASISIDYLNAFYAGLATGKDGIISLSNTRGILVARSPFRDDKIGTDLSGSDIFTRFLPQSSEGSFRYVSALEGAERLGSYRHVQQYPLVVVVAHGYQHIIADWWQDAISHLAFSSAVAIVLAGAGVNIAAKLRRRQRAERRYRLLAENCIDAIVSLDVTGRQLYVSPAFETLTGWSAAEGNGRDWTRHVHTDDREALHLAIGRLRAGESEFSVEYRYCCQDGRQQWVEARCMMVPAGHDEEAQIVANIRDISGRKASELRQAAVNQELATQANTDGLTGLANRRRFDEALDQERQRAAREETPLSLILLDVDRFKLFNDRYGHIAGDRCLAAVAAALHGVGRRPGDLVARYGGEEIVVLLPGTPVDGALSRADAIRASIEALGIEHDGNPPAGVVTISVGVSTCYPLQQGKAFPAASIVGLADAALYEAKRTGRNKVVHHADLPMLPPRLDDEQERLATLARYHLAGGETERSDVLDRLARLTAALFQVPIALVSLVGQDRQYFVGRCGLPGDGTGRDVSFCAYTLAGPDVLTIADASDDLRFAHNPLVTGGPRIRFYAGATLIAPNGHHLGALCIIDQVARPGLTHAQKALLANLAALAVDHLSERSQARL